MNTIHATTIVCVRKGGTTVMAGDGQVSAGQIILKGNAVKVRRLYSGNVLSGFAGATADAFTLMERFESRLQEYGGNLLRSAVELAKDWRTDRTLRRLEAMMIVADRNTMLLLTGQGDVIDPEEDIIAIGSGGNYALSAGRALMKHSGLDAESIARESLNIAAGLCVYTNTNIRVEVLNA